MLGTMVPSYEMKLSTMPQNKTKIKPRIPFEPDYAVAPGLTLLETIETLGIGRLVSLVLHDKSNHQKRSAKTPPTKGAGTLRNAVRS
jgi:hypothetical protein